MAVRHFTQGNHMPEYLKYAAILLGVLVGSFPSCAAPWNPGWRLNPVLWSG
jgi:hypothetical protein